jgi:hypothetical protein
VLENIIKLTKHLLDTGRLNGIHWNTLDSSSDSMPWDPEYTDYLLRYVFLADNVVDYSTLTMTYGQAYPYPYIEGTKGKAVQLSESFGINTDSSVSVKRAAWELLKVLISDEIQNSGLFNASAVVSELTREGVARNLYGLEYAQATEARAREMAESVTQEMLDKYNNDRMDYFADITQLYYRTAEGVEGEMFDNSIPYFRNNASFEDTIASIAKGIADNKAWQEYSAYQASSGNAGNAGAGGQSVGDRKLLELLQKKGN